MSDAPRLMASGPLSGQQLGGLHLAARQLLDEEGAFGRGLIDAPADARHLGLGAGQLVGKPLVSDALLRHPVRQRSEIGFAHSSNMHQTHIPGQELHACKALNERAASAHNMRMAQKPHPKHFLREWRKHHGLSIDALIERIKANVEDRVLAEGEEGDMKRLGLSQPNISRIERGDIPYNQTILELIAEVYGVDAASLIIRDPSDPDGLWSIYDQIEPTQRQTALRVLEGFKRTGTDG